MSIRHVSMLLIFLVFTTTEAAGRRALAVFMQYVASPAAVIGAGYFTSQEGVRAEPRLTGAKLHEWAENERRVIMTVNPYSQEQTVTLSQAQIEDTCTRLQLPADFLAYSQVKTRTANHPLTIPELWIAITASFAAYQKYQSRHLWYITIFPLATRQAFMIALLDKQPELADKAVALFVEIAEQKS